MILILGIDSAMNLVEGFVQAMREIWPAMSPVKALFIMCASQFVCGLSMATPGGYELLDIIDFHNTVILLVAIGGLECFLVGWGYGADRLAKETTAATGEEASWLPFLWPTLVKYVTPAILAAVLLMAFVNYANYGDYPDWALILFGWLMSIVFPAVAVAVLYFSPPLVDARVLKGAQHVMKGRSERREFAQ